MDGGGDAGEAGRDGAVGRELVSRAARSSATTLASVRPTFPSNKFGSKKSRDDDAIVLRDRGEVRTASRPAVRAETPTPRRFRFDASKHSTISSPASRADAGRGGRWQLLRGIVWALVRAKGSRLVSLLGSKSTTSSIEGGAIGRNRSGSRLDELQFGKMPPALPRAGAEHPLGQRRQPTEII